MDEELISLLLLHHVKGLTPHSLKNLLKTHGSAQEIVHRFPAWREQEGWKKDLEECEKKKITLISYRDPLYPKRLLSHSFFPLLLYVQGSLDGVSETIAIIGTRNATPYGKEMAEQFGAALASRGVCVISGLARGIDTAAHRGALKSGKTIAVLGSGISSLYPKENQKLADEISERGALVSQYPMLTPPFRSQFPARNKIIAALSDKVLLVESPLQGGGMLTMQFGLEMGKPLFALPGRIDMESFAGNHAWIKSNQAKLIDSPNDFFPSNPRK